MAKQTIGEFLSTLRKANGYTQQEVADKLNVSNRTLSSWETDRTIPDVLILPEIADLYGVTADEILRGERRGEARPEISPEAKKSGRKHRYGKYISKLLLFGAFAVLGTVLFAVGSGLTLYTYSKFYLDIWLDIVILVVGAVCATVFSVLVFYFSRITTCAEGIILKEDLTEENKAFALNLRCKSAVFLSFLSLPLLACGIVIGLLLIFDPPSYYSYGSRVNEVLYPYICFMCVNLALGVLLIAASAICYNMNITWLGNDTQKQVRRHNCRLLAKTCGFCSIPVVLLAIVWVILHSVLSYRVTCIYSSKDFATFKAHMETLTISEDIVDVGSHTVPAGEYVLQFPESYPNEKATQGVYNNLGNGFWGELHTDESIDGCIGTINHSWTVYYNPSITDVSQIGEYGLFGGDESLHGKWIGYYECDHFGSEQIYVCVRQEYQYNYFFTYFHDWGDREVDYYSTYVGGGDGYYGYFLRERYDFTYFAGGIFLAATAATVVIGGIIYFVKRKKQNFGF